MTGRLCLALHAHLPFVRHPEHDPFLEEDWLYQALAEAYLPLLDVFDRLDAEGVPFRLTMTVSPTLTAMLEDPLLNERFSHRLDALCELGAQETRRTQADERFREVAAFHHQRLQALRRQYAARRGKSLVAAFRRLQNSGRLELVACAATHAFLPLLATRPSSVAAQVSVGVAEYRRAFGRAPTGFWLPECGYFPGVEDVLAAHGVRYFFVESHAAALCRPAAVHGPWAPLFTPAGVAAFARDPESSAQVWSAQSGYPADPLYRDFYRDIGWDLDAAYLRPWLQADGARKALGFKYHRVTGPTAQKAPYAPPLARRRAEEHAAHFVARTAQQVERLGAQLEAPIIVAPYDAELFGHWWFEGPWFLEAVLRQSAAQNAFALATPADVLRESPAAQRVELPLSSWGEGGYAARWLAPSNDWIYAPLLAASARMGRLADRFPAARGDTGRALAQAARELLLAQSSDWPFILETGTMAEYATRRVRDHLNRFGELARQLEQGRIDRPALGELEARDNLFPDLDYRVYRS